MTEVELSNWALLKLGQCPIESHDKGGIQASYCRILYPPLHRGLLRSFAWSFATMSACLSEDFPQDSDEVIYDLPHKCLKVLKIDKDGILRGNCIVVKRGDAGLLGIEYIEEVPLSVCDPLYQEVLSLKLASELCPTLVGDDQLRAYLKGESDRVLELAKTTDSIELQIDREY